MIKKIFNRVVLNKEKTWSMDAEHFDWAPGAFLIGAFQAYEYTKDAEILNYLINWTDRHLHEAFDKITVNSIAPLTMIAKLYELTGNKEYLDVCDKIAQWVFNEAPITIDGGLEHTVTEKDKHFRNQMWADTLFMACVFMAKTGTVTGKREYHDFAVKQLYLHHRFLKDKKTGLFFHGWNGSNRSHMSGVLWSRANAWITFATPVILRETGNHYEKYEEIVSSLNEQVRALFKYQKEDGGFSTVIDRTEGFSETSAEAGLVAGIRTAQSMGLLERNYEDETSKAEKHVISMINSDGTLEMVSGGTPVLKKAEDYLKKNCTPALYGQGLALYMLSLPM